MKLVRTVSALVLLATSGAMSGCTLWDVLNGLFARPHDVVIEDRARMQWQSLRLAEVATDSGPAIPADWGAGAFVSADAFRDVGSRLVGARFTNTGDSTLRGSVLSIEKFDLTPDTGLMAATAKVRLSIPTYGVTLNADADLAAHFVRFEPAAGDTKAQAVFRWQPIALRPYLGNEATTFSSRGAVARAIADMLEMYKESGAFEFRFPVDDRVALSFGIDETGTIDIRETGGAITYKATSPKTVMDRALEFAPPLFGKQGVWLVARLGKDKPEDWIARLGPTPGADAIAAESARIAKVIESRFPARDGDADIVAFVSSNTLTTLVDSISKLSPESRKITVTSTGSTGKLAEQKWRDDVLGDGGVYAELASGGASLIGELGVPAVSAGDTGLQVSISTKVSAKASVHIHVDPLIGGGVGTVVGLLGGANDTLTITMKPTILESEAGKVAALSSTMACASLPVDIQTDGVLKFPGGWASVPKVGVRWQWPAGKQVIPPVAVFDERPSFASFVPPPSEKNPDWTPGHTDPAASIVLKPVAAEMRHSGLWFAAKLAMTSIPVTVKPGESLGAALSQVRGTVLANAKATSEATAKSLRAAAKTECAAQEEMALLIDKVEIGKNNEIVKLLGEIMANTKNGIAVGSSALEVGKKVGEIVFKLDLSKTPELKAEVDKMIENTGRLIDESPGGKIVKEVVTGLTRTVAELAKKAPKVGKEGDTIIVGPLKTKDPFHGWKCC